jgi:hypothetical protein
MLDLLVAAVIAMSPQNSPAAPADTDTTVIYEDDPRWDCRTMGNRECGVGNEQGVPAGDYGEIDSE